MSPARRPRALLRALRLLGGVAGLSGILGLAGAPPRPAPAPTPPAGGVSFRRDVVQVLSKAGCNAGACHGNARGKGGLKLSLRGEDPAADYQALVEDLSGRRLDRVRPADSLLLLKATAAVPHEGGQRFPPDAPAARRLREWIAAGAVDDGTNAPVLARLEVSPTERVLVEPASDLALRAIAHFADGSRRDVTSEAVYETSNPFVQVSPDGRIRRERFGETVVLVRYLGRQEPVRVGFVPARPSFRWSDPRPSNYVDAHVFAKLRRFRLNPGPVVDDALFLRRVHLDLLGGLPKADEARSFLQDRAPDKRERLVDALLERPEFADFWALKWSDLLRVEERTLDRKGLEAFHGWIREGFATNRPLDAFARELITARGSTYLNPAANFYRANRTPIDRALSVSQVFLGTRLTCAQCHNHPFDRWTQDDYHDWGAVFARVRYKVLRNDRQDDNDAHEFKGEQVVYVSATGDLPNPRTGQPARPRMLGVPEPMAQAPLSGPGGGRYDALEQVARWLTSNRDFARVQANRIWANLMGRGLVDPVDDFRATNPASHPELLEALGADFARHGHDVRHLIRTILASRTYQAAPRPSTAPDAEDDVNLAHALPRRLSAEQLLNAQHQVTGVPFRVPNAPGITRVLQLPGGAPLTTAGATPEDAFLQAFGKPKRLLTCECERSEATTMGQALELIAGPALHRMLTDPENRLRHLLEQDPSGDDAVQELYWHALSRPPRAEETARLRERLVADPTPAGRRAALEDLAWALLNSKEFVLRQ